MQTDRIPTILLVDDEQDFLDLFGLILGRLPARVLKAGDGETALALTEESIPDLILLDLALPEMSGIEVLRTLRRDPRFETTHILLLTAVPVMLDKCDLSLITGLLTKPIGIHVLETAVRNALAGQGSC